MIGVLPVSVTESYSSPVGTFGSCWRSGQDDIKGVWSAGQRYHGPSRREQRSAVASHSGSYAIILWTMWLTSLQRRERRNPIHYPSFPPLCILGLGQCRLRGSCGLGCEGNLPTVGFELCPFPDHPHNGQTTVEASGAVRLEVACKGYILTAANDDVPTMSGTMDVCRKADEAWHRCACHR